MIDSILESVHIQESVRASSSQNIHENGSLFWSLRRMNIHLKIIHGVVGTPGNGKNIYSAYSWLSLTIVPFSLQHEKMRLSAKITDTHLDVVNVSCDMHDETDHFSSHY